MPAYVSQKKIEVDSTCVLSAEIFFVLYFSIKKFKQVFVIFSVFNIKCPHMSVKKKLKLIQLGALYTGHNL